MSRTVAIVGALDTKGEDFRYVKELIEGEGLSTLVVDFGVMGAPKLHADIGRAEVAAAGGGDLGRMSSGKHKDEAMESMAAGLTIIVARLHAEGRLDGILSMGGTGGTSIATRAMRALPVGVPKLMVSTIGGGDVSAFAGTKDITFMPSIVDVSGVNRISRRIYANAAGAISGMVRMKASAGAEDKRLVVASMFGNTTVAVEHAKSILEGKGYELLVFHATGTGGRTMEALITDGYISGSLDITMTELADEICGGVMSAGPDRGLAASLAGIPTVLVPGCVDMANFGGVETVPQRYLNRNLYKWNLDVTLLRTNIEENRWIGERIAAAANAATGPVAVLLPLKGVSMLDSEGHEFWDPAADIACFDKIRGGLNADIPLIEVDANINDPKFSGKVAETLLGLMAGRTLSVPRRQLGVS
jgi:uncharacterized protein (UPF0261 family)